MSTDLSAAVGTLLTDYHRYVAVMAAPFDLSEVTLLSLKGEEGLGTPFRYEAKLVSFRRIRNLPDVVGQPITVALKLADGSNRYFTGFIQSLAFTGLFDGRRPTYAAVIVSWLSLLDYRRDCRIFQNKTSLEIVETIFREYPENDFAIKVRTEPPKREFCVQYNETDLAFVSRLLEQDGIYYFFQHEEKRHRLVLADGSSAHQPCDPEIIPTNPTAHRFMFQEDNFREWNEAVSLQTHKIVLDDHNHLTPDAQLTAIATVPSVDLGDVPVAVEEQQFDGMASGHSGEKRNETQPGPDADRREAYTYPGRYLTQADGQYYAKVAAEEVACRAYRAQVLGNPRQLCVGQTFLTANPYEIIDTLLAPSPDQRWLTLWCSFEISGEEPDDEPVALRGSPRGEQKSFLYRCRIAAQPAATTFRPPLSTPRPRIAGPQTAVVVGHADEVVTTGDPASLDRIKVQFFWDRRGKRDIDSSCWIRVAQPLAGGQFGGMVLPRVGQEVVVSFIDGNPDWPLVTGAVYNTKLVSPETVTASAAQSIFRTQTVDGTPNQFNEVRFDDTNGAEEVFNRAQKDWRLHVKHDCDIRADNALTARVTGELGDAGPTSWIEMGSDSMRLSVAAMGTNPLAPASWMELGIGKLTIGLRTAPGPLGTQLIEFTPAGIVVVGTTIALQAMSPPEGEEMPITSFPVIPVVEPSPLALAAMEELAIPSNVAPSPPMRA